MWEIHKLYELFYQPAYIALCVSVQFCGVYHSSFRIKWAQYKSLTFGENVSVIWEAEETKKKSEIATEFIILPNMLSMYVKIKISSDFKTMMDGLIVLKKGITFLLKLWGKWSVDTEAANHGNINDDVSTNCCKLFLIEMLMRFQYLMRWAYSLITLLTKYL